MSFYTERQLLNIIHQAYNDLSLGLKTDTTYERSFNVLINLKIIIDKENAYEQQQK